MKITSGTSFWHSLSFSHLLLADKLTELSRELESNNLNTDDIELVKPYCIGAITAATGFLETNINEQFEAVSSNDYLLKYYLNEKNIHDINVWSNKSKRATTMQKYQSFLSLSGKRKFNEKKQYVKDVYILIHLRNRLAHYKPEWISGDNKELIIKDYQSYLESIIPPCEFFKNTANPFYPDKLLGYGSAKWALNTAFYFSQEFYKKMNMDLPYEHILENCSQLKNK